MSYPHSHKTVFVLDHCPQFAMPCDSVEFDMQRTRGPGFIPLAPISKRVWTCVVEATLEYCRIVWDIFPEDKCIRYVVSCNPPELLNGWQAAHQNSASLGTALTAIARPESRRKGGGEMNNVLAGITKALEALCETTGRQDQVLQRLEEEGGGQLINRGRLVVITTVKDDNYRQQLLSAVVEELSGVNKRAADHVQTSSMLPISHVELVLVHTGADTRVTAETDKVEHFSPHMSTVLYTVPAGPTLASKLLYLCLKHYDLASTTVTGIPMKEEQNASSSANYDVELFHSAESHDKLVKDDADMALALKDGCEYQTATLKWCTPRGNAAVELHHCSGAFRVTPVEVNSRQSSCLTNFLLSGRSVMLEMQKRSSGAKTLSHMLTSHGGEIFIHSLCTGRNPLDEPPSISEGPGGRVTDYRIRDLAELMRSNMLGPWPGDPGQGAEQPVAKAGEKVDRFTRFFPFTISSTIIFNMAAIDPLLAALTQESMTDDDVTSCRKVIYQLLSMEQKGEVLPGGQTSPGQGGKKGAKKEEQYRIMFTELERFVQVHSDRSGQHHAVLECLMEVRNKPLEKSIKKEEAEADGAMRELNKRERADFNMTDGGVLRATSDSPLSPPVLLQGPPAKKQRLFGTGGASLLDLWRARLEREAGMKHVEFAGRRNLGEIAKLYLNLETKDNKELEMK